MSPDGWQWKDITPSHGHFPQIVSIFQDPDSPNRVCFLEWDIRGVIYQPDDDNYSKWTAYLGGEWEKRAKKSRQGH
jgi:hypothetical protein